MHRRRNKIIVLLFVLLFFWVIAYPLNNWFSETMPRHQTLQLPLAIALGLLLANYYKWLSFKNIGWALGCLIFIIASITFWMIPHSIDSAVIDARFNRLLLINMLLCGFLIRRILEDTLFEIKIIFMGMLSVMTLATGLTLRAFTILLCSSFTIEQQIETGLYLIIIGFILFLITYILLFKTLRKYKAK